MAAAPAVGRRYVGLCTPATPSWQHDVHLGVEGRGVGAVIGFRTSAVLVYMDTYERMYVCGRGIFALQKMNLD